MCFRALIFGGTTEGRLLAQFCHENQIEVSVSVASGYGREVLPQSPFLHIHESPMDEKEMESFFKTQGIALVVDATHPYADKVSENIRRACERTKTRLLRVVRKEAEGSCEGKASRVWCESVADAAAYLDKTEGAILLTTGSKELSAFLTLSSWKERLFVRVLPSSSVLAACEQMGVSGKHLIAMQGPFSEELNRAIIKQYEIRYLVTKEAGKAGGFPEKLQAAEALGITVVIIGRPKREEGVTLEEAQGALLAQKQPVSLPKAKARISLIGVGMGGPGQMTVSALSELSSCQVLFGAERMLHGISSLAPKAVKVPFYLSQDILPWLKEHKELQRVGILYSGDTGFYSGAKKLLFALEEEPWRENWEVEVFPGISTVSYLSARLKTNWEDVKLLSLHGREEDAVGALKEHQRVFFLLDGRHTVKSLCAALKEAGLEQTRLSVGERLSYPEERIVTGSPKELEEQEFDSLAAVLIERVRT